MLNQGAVMYWVGGEACVELERDIPSPLGAFVPGGPLVLASASWLILLEVDFRGVHKVLRVDLTGQQIAGVAAAANAGDFAVLSQNGSLTVYRIPR
jgi:hypothetical protein